MREAKAAKELAQTTTALKSTLTAIGVGGRGFGGIGKPAGSGYTRAVPPRPKPDLEVNGAAAAAGTGAGRGGGTGYGQQQAAGPAGAAELAGRGAADGGPAAASDQRDLAQISVDDLMAVMERDPLYSKGAHLFQLYATAHLPSQDRGVNGR